MQQSTAIPPTTRGARKLRSEEQNSPLSESSAQEGRAHCRPKTQPSESTAARRLRAGQPVGRVHPKTATRQSQERRARAKESGRNERLPPPRHSHRLFPGRHTDSQTDDQADDQTARRRDRRPVSRSDKEPAAAFLRSAGPKISSSLYRCCRLSDAFPGSRSLNGPEVQSRAVSPSLSPPGAKTLPARGCSCAGSLRRSVSVRSVRSSVHDRSSILCPIPSLPEKPLSRQRPGALGQLAAPSRRPAAAGPPRGPALSHPAVVGLFW